MTNFEKYLKYKKKYLELKNKLTGGGWSSLHANPPLEKIPTKGGGWGSVNNENNLQNGGWGLDFSKIFLNKSNNKNFAMKGGWGLSGIRLN